MLGFLFKKEKSKSDAQGLQEIYRKLDHLQQALEHEVRHQKASEIHIHIDYLNLDRPVLESLIFRLDQLDINELGGTLNIGNNIGTVPKKSAKWVDTSTGKQGNSADKKSQPKTEEPEIDQQFRQTTAGYSYRRKS